MCLTHQLGCVLRCLISSLLQKKYEHFLCRLKNQSLEEKNVFDNGTHCTVKERHAILLGSACLLA